MTRCARHRAAAVESVRPRRSSSLRKARRSWSPTSTVTRRPRSRSEIGGVAVRVDVSDEASVAAMVAFAVERFGGIDWACNIAGIAPDAEAVRRSHRRRLAAHDRRRSLRRVLCMQHELRQMLAQGHGGAIVNMSSAAGLVPAPGQPQYTAAKHARARDHEAGRAGVRERRHPGQRGAAGPDRDRADARVPRRATRWRRTHAPAPPDEAHGDARRDRGDGRLVVLRRAASYVNGVSLARRRRPRVEDP